MKVLVTFLILLSGLANGQWTRVSDYPGTERDDACGFEFQNSYWIGTGQASGWVPQNNFYKFDLITETWSAATSLPSSGRQYAASASADTTAFIFGGSYGLQFNNELWKINTSGWSQLTGLPASARDGSTAVIIDTSLFVIGGQDSMYTTLKEIWIYNLATGQWKITADLPYARWRHSTVTYDGKIYSFFGKDEYGTLRKDVVEYDPVNESNSIISEFPGNGRNYVSAFKIDSCVLFFGGVDSSGNCFNDLWRFDLNDHIWTRLTDLPASGRKGGILFGDRTKLFYTTGINGSNVRLKETWKYENPLGTKEELKRKKECDISIHQSTIRSEDPGFEITLTDMSGRMIFSEYSNGETLVIPEFPAGVYCYSVRSKNCRTSGLKMIGY